MGNSLQEQLLQAGLVDEAKLKKAKQQKHKQKRKARPTAKPPTSAEETERRRLKAEKAAHDRELNQQRNEVRRQREVAAQVRQLVRDHRVPRSTSDDDVAFNFQNKEKIKRLFVSPEQHKKISAGQLVIVNDNGNFELVPPAVAEKIRQRNPSLVIDLPDDSNSDTDDAYADFKVPDDLMW